MSRLIVSDSELYGSSTKFILIALTVLFILQASIQTTSLFSSINKVLYKNPIDKKGIKQSTIFFTLTGLLYFSLLVSTIINEPNLAMLIVLTTIIFFGIYYLIQKYQPTVLFQLLVVIIIFLIIWIGSGLLLDSQIRNIVGMI